MWVGPRAGGRTCYSATLLARPSLQLGGTSDSRRIWSLKKGDRPPDCYKAYQSGSLAPSLNMGITNITLLSIPLVLQGFLLVLLFRQRLYWQYPFFFVYTGYSVLATVALLVASSHYRVYFVVYWANSAVLTVLVILALHEVFRRVFWGFFVSYRWFRLLFSAAAAVAFLVVFLCNPRARNSP